MANIQEVKSRDGRVIGWRVEWYENGKRHRSSVHHDHAQAVSEKSLHDYKRAVRGARRATASPIVIAAGKGKVSPKVAALAHELIGLADRPNTRRAYLQAVGRIEQEPLAEMMVHHVTPSDIRVFRASVRKNWGNVYRLLRKVFNAAVREGHITVSPLKQANLPRAKNGKRNLRWGDPRILTADQVEALARAALQDGPRVPGRMREQNALAIRIGAYVGLRGGEVGALTVPDIDFENFRINVNRNVVRYKGVTFGDPKSETSIRSCAVDGSLTTDIHDHVEKWGTLPGSDGIIFYTQHGNPLKAENLTEATKRAGMRALGRPVRFHDLRHTCASLLIGARMEPKAIQEYLGHATVGQTYDVYGALFPEADRPLAQAMGALRKAAETKVLSADPNALPAAEAS